jgi:hypothetical protein
MNFLGRSYYRQGAHEIMESKSQTLYQPIKSYQIRVISLHKDNNISDTPLSCELHTAVILHAKFEGILLHRP